MNEFRFAEPGWIHLTWVVLAVAGLLVYCEFRGRSVLERFVSRLLQSRLAHRPPLGFRIVSLVFVTMAMLLLVVALMRPQWGMRVQKSLKLNAQIMICLDVSRSMLAEDVAPNRLDRAKIELDSLLGLLDEGQQVGLIAFAGKATVLCPMTPDFGFLRLILNETEPSSVGLGGTHIGDAIRKAVDGFRDAGDIHRLILLVTDGEDHDSYPLNAAKAAKEKGVKIVSIGFGDEAGSKIEVTDPVTGATSYIQDRNGQDVVSRLDGETLREIALQTDGAYIPAGTGALDLEAIYRAHIESLLRGTTDSTERTVRNEAFQWPVLLSLVFVLAGLLVVMPIQRPVSGGLNTDHGRGAVPGAATALTLLVMCVSADTALAQTQGPTPAAETRSEPTAPAGISTKASPTAPAPSSQDDTDAVAMPSSADTATSENLPPRGVYNRAVSLLPTDLDKAESLLNTARSDAGIDGELRYRSLYNLGWLEVARADAQLKADPEKAKNHLQQAVNRFREAVRVRPDAEEARYNLEVASRRLLELTDSLAKRDPGDVAKRLDELIEQLRAHQAELQSAVQQTGEEVEKSLAETYRQQFRQLGVTQRQMIADLQQLVDDARKELDALQKKPADKQTPEEGLKAGQLNNMLHFADSCLQRLNQSRSLTRRLQGNRAFRRWSVGLSDAKRARDQLRNPLELIGLLIADANELIQSTKTLATSSASLSVDDKTEPAPVWLNREYIQDQQSSMLDRTKELVQVLSNAQPAESPTSSPAGGAEQVPPPDPRTKRLLDSIQTALPLLNGAVERFGEAAEEIAGGSLDTVHTKQLEATVELTRAWELFLDVRRLIEVTYANTSMLRQVVAGVEGTDDTLKQMAVALRDGNQVNIQRAARLKEMVEFELSQPVEDASAPGAPTTPGAGGAAQTPAENPERQRYELALKLLEPVTQHLANVDRELSTIVEAAPVETELDAALISLEELRRLFFSIVEHLRETAQRQADVNDDTRQQSPLPPESQTADKIGPLAARQSQLQQFTQTLVSALKEQSQQAAQATGDEQTGGASTAEGQAAAAQEAGKKLAQAAELVDAAEKAMATAAGELTAQAEKYDAADKPYEKVTAQQAIALQKLVEALAILDQSPPDQQQQDQQDQQNQQEQQQEQQNQQEQSAQQQNLSANQLLQLIRDREAQRREEKKQRQRSSASGVDKDW
jgi:Ca-activated chloride channel family protein